MLREGWFLDVKQAWRGLARARGFALFVVLLIALGVGANTALFSVVRTVLLEPLPYPDSRRLVRVWETHPSASAFHERPSPGNFQYWRQNNDVFSGMAAWYVASVTLRESGGAAT